MKDVVISGLGAVTPLGGSVPETWDAVQRGESGAAPISLFDPEEMAYDFRSKITCEVPIDPTDHDAVDQKNMGRHSQLAAIAAQEALEDAGYGSDPDWDDPRAVGVSVASSLGDLGEIETATLGLEETGSVPTRFSFRFLPNLPSGHVSMACDARGPNRTECTACAAGTHAISDAVDDIRLGRADVMIAGGTEAGVRPTPMSSFDVLRALSTRNDAPEAAVRPFDEDRDGFVIAEGAGILVLESAERAEARGAPIYATIEGSGRSSDATHPTRPPEDARGLRAAVGNALRDAGLDPADVDHLNAHGTSTPRGDEHEALCFNESFDDVPPVTSNKSMMGHTLGAAGAIEAVIACLTLHDATLPPTINHATTDPDCDLPVVQEATEAAVDTVLSTSAGFGGTNGAIVFGSYE